jgi:16S rRNA processing protein RimM
VSADREPSLDEWSVIVGRVGKPHGLHGEISVVPITDRIERFAELDVLAVFPPSGRPWIGHVEGFRPIKKRAHLTLREITDRDAAHELQGSELRIRPEMRYELAEDEYWVDDLIGLEVVTEEGRPLGRVTEVLTLPANDVLVTEHCLVPVLKDVLVSVDGEAGKIVIRPMEGMAPELGI